MYSNQDLRQSHARATLTTKHAVCDNSPRMVSTKPLYLRFTAVARAIHMSGQEPGNLDLVGTFLNPQEACKVLGLDPNSLETPDPTCPGVLTHKRKHPAGSTIHVLVNVEVGVTAHDTHDNWD